MCPVTLTRQQTGCVFNIGVPRSAHNLSDSTQAVELDLGGVTGLDKPPLHHKSGVTMSVALTSQSVMSLRVTI